MVMGIFSHFASWLSQRLGLPVLGRLADKKTVPDDGATARHYLGGASLFFFAIQILTGVLLSMYYIPTVDGAFESIQHITFFVEYGWLVRSLHKWSANLMVVSLALHLTVTFLFRSYRAPRELTWMTGWLMLLLVLGICFFGYVLPWNDIAFFATRTGIDIMGNVPLIGGLLKALVQGGDHFTSHTLTRFYFFHIMLLPGLLSVCLIVHLYLIQLHGVSCRSAKRTGVEEIRFFPTFMSRTFIFWTVLVNLLFLLSFLFPQKAGYPANEFEPTPSGIKPEWYFLPLYQTFKTMPSIDIGLLGEQLALLLVIFFFGVAFILPLFDAQERATKTGHAMRIALVAAGLYVVAMGVLGHLS